MRRRNHAAHLLEERVMTKTRKFQLIRVGDAKVLTRGEDGPGDELVTMHRPQG